MVKRYRPNGVLSGVAELPAFATPKKNLYFGDSNVQFIDTGCVLLNCVVSGAGDKGWPLGRVVNIVGDRSTGKCARDYFVLTSEGLKYSEDVVPTKPYGASDLNWIMALDRDSNVKATKFWKERVSSTIHVETQHGMELTGTLDHKLQVMTPEGLLLMKRLKDIQIGDWLVVSLGTDLFPQQPVSLAGFRPIARVWKYSELIPPQTVTPLLASWLGALVADGTTSSGPLTITAHKDWKRNLLTTWSEQLFPGAYTTTPESFKYTGQIKDLVAHCWGSSLQGSTARYKRVPDVVLRSPKEVQAAFLKALMCFDGEQPPGGLIWSTSSRRLVREVQMMLLNFGVFATLGKKYSKDQDWTYYSLSIYGQRFDEFLRLIGVHRPANKTRRSITTTSSILSIPFGMAMLRAELTSLRKRLGWAQNGKLSDGRKLPQTGVFCRNGDSASYEYFEKIVNRLKEYTSPEFRINADMLLNKRFVFDQITKKSVIKGAQIVSDVHVPNGNLFWASGLINHNTLLAEEAMANFQKSYPKGKTYYRETEAAFDLSYAQALGLNTAKVDFGDDGPDTKWSTMEDIIEDVRGILDDWEDRVKENSSSLRKKNKRLRLPEAVDQAVKAMPPILYIIDSLDALTSEAELNRDVRKGSYNLEKQKLLGEFFRKEIRRLKAAKVCLIIISQTRVRIGPMIRGSKYTRTGGDALNFYASVVIYLAQLGKVFQQSKGIKRPVAIKVRVRCEKNKITMPFRECMFDLRFGYGIDDVCASLDWLEEIKRLKDAGFPGKEAPGVEDVDVKKLRQDVANIWYDIERDFIPTKGKYA